MRLENRLTIDIIRKEEEEDDWKEDTCNIEQLTIITTVGCYITCLWMAKCASVMTKMLPLYNFAIPCRGRRGWKTLRYARAFAGSRF